MNMIYLCEVVVQCPVPCLHRSFKFSLLMQERMNICCSRSSVLISTHLHFTTKQENFPFVKQRIYFDQSYDKLQYGGIAILSKLTGV